MKELFLLRPDITYLNHGSFGACPRPVFDEYQRWQRELEYQPVEFLDRRFQELMYTARSSLAEYLGTEANNLVFVPNATTGLNIVVRSLELNPGDEVLSTDHEYGALDRTWQYYCELTNSLYKKVSLPLDIQSDEEIVEKIWTGVTDRTRILFISHITSPTALLLPVSELIERAKNAGILSIIDGAHAPGQISLNLHELNPDFYSGNCHKWMLCPKGSAFLYVKPSLQHLIKPHVVSWGWKPETPGPSPFIDLLQWQGTNDIAAYLTVPRAIQFMTEQNWSEVAGASRQLISQAQERLAVDTLLYPIRQPQNDNSLQMTSFLLPSCDPLKLKDSLYCDHHIEIPVIDWKTEHLLRISINAYNTWSDVQYLIDSLNKILHKPFPVSSKLD